MCATLASGKPGPLSSRALGPAVAASRSELCMQKNRDGDRDRDGARERERESDRDSRIRKSSKANEKKKYFNCQEISEHPRVC